jgi:hypothetical protein
MATASRVQDGRMVSRVNAHLDCQFIFEGISREASIRDLSLTGAFLSSIFLPSKGSDVTITLQTPLSKNTLILEGKVTRVGWGGTHYDRRHRFGVRFSHTPPGIITLIHELSS